MLGRIAAFATALVLGAVLLFELTGWLAPVDLALRDLRTASWERRATEQVVFVDIDGQTLSEIGVWPWPRSIHARLIDRLMEMGADKVVLDIDFSTASSPSEDAALAAALKRSGGYAMLAAFRQLPGTGSTTRGSYNLPIQELRRETETVLVNVGIDQRGMVRTYPFGAWLGDTAYRSAAAALSGVGGPPESAFLIDWSIQVRDVPRIPAGEILAGRVDAEAVAGRQVIVGSSALELHDIFITPQAGAVPGGLVQAIATETLLQHRALVPLGSALPLGLSALLALLWIRGRDRLRLGRTVGIALAVSVLVEALAVLLQVQWGLLLETAVVHVAQVAMLLRAVALDVGAKSVLHLKASHERDAMRAILDRVISDNFDGVVVIEATGTIVAASRLAEAFLGAGLTGRGAAEVLPRQIARAVQRNLETTGEDTPRAAPAELLIQTATAGARIIEYAITRSEVPEYQGGGHLALRRVACLTFRDITERRENEQRLNYLASYDAMTGVWSRFKLIEMIDELLTDDGTRERGVSVALVDLRRFKTVNDTLGHSYGDMVLRQLASRLRACDVGAVARLGADGFALARPGEMTAADLEAFCRGVIERVTATYHLEAGHQVTLAAAVGATTTALSGYDAEVLLSHADMALSAAKRMPGSNVAVFQPEMGARLKSKQEMEAALRTAIAGGRLSLSYQPQVALDSGALVGVEALVRWVDPSLGTVPPSLFVPAAEETGQIVELGRFVLRRACADAASWPRKVRLAVNVSPMQFELSDVVAEVEQALALSGLEPDRLDLEITEGLFMARDGKVTRELARLRGMGIGIALDDFGTGYSSLSYLGRLPVDKIKIDQSFVRSLPADQEAGAIVRAVMTLSETLGKVVVAEGIETSDQAWMLRILGCHIGQGYHFGRPKSPAEMARLLADPVAAPMLVRAGG